MTNYSHEKSMQKRKLEICSEAAQNIQDCINNRFIDIIRSNWQGDDANYMISKIKSISETAGNVKNLTETIKTKVDIVYNALERETDSTGGGGSR